MKRRGKSPAEMTAEELAGKLNHIAAQAGRGSIANTREQRREVVSVLFEAARCLKGPDTEWDPGAMERGDILDRIAAERVRQIDAEGYSAAHDDGHVRGELAFAAAAYCSAAGRERPDMWPWEPEAFKPRGKRRDLVRAAALIVAEIERLDRAAVRTEGLDPSPEAEAGP